MSMHVTLDAWEKNSEDRLIQEGEAVLTIEPSGIGNVPYLEIDLSQCRLIGNKVYLRVSELVRSVNCLTGKDSSNV